MKRRDFIRHGGIAGVLAAGTAPAFAQGQEFKWRMTSSFPKSLDTLYGANEQVARRVAELTNNKFQLRTFAAGEIVPGLQVLDAVQNATVEVGQTAMYYYFGKNPAFAYATCLPFGLNARLAGRAPVDAFWRSGFFVPGRHLPSGDRLSKYPLSSDIGNSQPLPVRLDRGGDDPMAEGRVQILSYAGRRDEREPWPGPAPLNSSIR